jgi:integrase
MFVKRTIRFMTDNGKVRYATPMNHKDLRVRKGSMPSTVNGKVPPPRVSNAARRPREYLTPEEVDRLMIAARKRIGSRNPHRDATMILIAYRHGLRASELCSLRWDMLDLAQGRFHVIRRKNGRPSGSRLTLDSRGGPSRGCAPAWRSRRRAWGRRWPQRGSG